MKMSGPAMLPAGDDPPQQRVRGSIIARAPLVCAGLSDR